ncbi:MAG: hypothetical protein U5K30_08400 [Acidimicrobiales bacterium]|nr:hypothetical protein [Acidimicrobiales bacterium]
MSTVLLLRCPDQPGIVAAVGQTIAGLGGNRAVRLHLQHRVLTDGNRTVVFN